MHHQVRVFEIARDAKPDERAHAIDGFAVTADTFDEAKSTAVARLASAGRVVRSISFLEGGGLVAVVHPVANPGGE